MVRRTSGPEPAEEAWDTLGGPDQGDREDELGGPDPGGREDVLGDPGPA